MLRNTLINRAAAKKVAEALIPLNQEMVFVGGAVVSLYIDDAAAEDIRPTKDIDLTFEIATSSALEKLRAELIDLGFVQSSEDKVVCRFRYDDLLVDVMSTQTVDWAPGSPWFAAGFSKAFTYEEDDLFIKLLPLPYFLASKVEAFWDRGLKDIQLSTDLEDIVYLFLHTSDIVEQVLGSEENVRAYLSSELKKMKENENVLNAMPGSLSYQNMETQMEMILGRMQEIIKGA